MTDVTPAEAPDPPASSPPEIDLRDLVSEWQYAQYRVMKLWQRADLRAEWLITLVLLAAVFFVPAISWVRVWTMPGSFQLYGIFTLPAVAIWCWAARLRLAVPEVAPIRNWLREQRRRRVMPLEIGEREKSVIRVLTEGEPVIDPRSSWLLIAAVVFDMCAFWVGEPMLTSIGFAFTCAGLVLYRHGRFALRTVAFPFLLLLLMTPIPAPLNDLGADRLQATVFNVVEHMSRNAKMQVELPPEGSPIKVTGNGRIYSFYAQRNGTGIPEGVLVLFALLTFLALVRTTNPVPKIGAFVAAALIAAVLVIGRLMLLCLVATFDTDIAVILEMVTRLLIVPVGFLISYYLAKGLGCKKYHRWVAISREF